MKKVIHCEDVGFECEGVVRAETEEEVIKLAGHYAIEVHDVKEITLEMVTAVKAAIRTE